MSKKIISLLLAAAMVCSLGVMAFAAVDERPTTVDFEVQEKYTITIPTTATVDVSAKTGTIEITPTELFLYPGYELKVTAGGSAVAADKLTMTNEKDATKTIEATLDKQSLSFNTTTAQTINLTFPDPGNAGKYSGTITFSISSEKVNTAP